mmetsp:Transcript_51664/g.144371  ORF Transcript_51664/g.144371 Transcript_51664/m.144371 type:complete len:167 (+) Transcript_51664:93-593(+)
MSERWQGEVRRLQAEKDQLGKLVLDLEGNTVDQGRKIQGVHEMHMKEVTALQEALRKKEEDMHAANVELLQKRDEDHQAKMSLERQREKDRSVALLRKKEQELQIKDQQLRAMRQRLREHEGVSGFEDGTTGVVHMSHPTCPSPRGGPRRTHSGDTSLPRLPLSAR